MTDIPYFDGLMGEEQREITLIYMDTVKDCMMKHTLN